MPLQLRVRPGWACLIGGSALLGLHRAIAFHPYFHGDYLRWLKSTPWTVRKPLPAGPMRTDPGRQPDRRLVDAPQPDPAQRRLDRSAQYLLIQPHDRPGQYLLADRGPGFRLLRSLVPGIRPQALVAALARPRGPDRPLPLRPRRSLAIPGPFSLAHGRSFERGKSGSTSRRGVWPILRLALRPLPTRCEHGQGGRSRRCHLDQYADRLVVFRTRSMDRRWVAAPGCLDGGILSLDATVSVVFPRICSLRSASQGGSSPSAGSSPVTIKPRSSSCWL